MSHHGNTQTETSWTSGSGNGPILLASLLLVYLVWAAFWPILGFEFIEFDVSSQLINNPHVHGLSAENVRHILTSKCVSSYYPVRTLTLALDYQVWGRRPFGFKLTNLLIHLVNVLLVFSLILRLLRHSVSPGGPSQSWWDIWAATFFAGIVAVHPVVVEPVAWIGGREELLMMLGALSCLHFHLAAIRASESNRGKGRALFYHTAAAVSCAVACLSNAVGAVIPLLTTTWDILILPRPRLWRIVRATTALWAIGLVTIAIKQLGQTGNSFTPLAPARTLQWLMVVLTTYWMNLTAIAWPTQLGTLYEWPGPQGFLETEVVLGGVAVVLTCLALWKLRRHKLTLFGLLWFLLALAPTSQLMLHNIARADRFLYLPLAGLAVAGALALRQLPVRLASLDSERSRRLALAAGLAASLAVLLTLNVLTASQVQTWRNNITVWTRCIEVAPDNSTAHGCLADSLSREGRFEEAIPHFETSLQLDPNNVISLNNYAIHLATSDEESLRDCERAVQLAERGCELSRWEDWTLRRTLAKACSNYAKVFNLRGQYDEAIHFCRKALEADPGFDAPTFNLAVILATCPAEELRDPEEAIRLVQEANARGGAPDAMRLRILAICYAEAGQFDNAIGTVGEAVRLAQAAGQVELADSLRDEMRSYQQRTPTGSEE